MSKKQKSAGSDNDEQANESSEPLSQNEDNTKRAKLDLLSATTLQHQPIEILELILIKAVVLEVMDLKLAKCVWKEKADPVISRLKQVCSLWSNILTSNCFRTEVYRTLDDTAQDTIRLDVLQESSGMPKIYRIVTLKDEIFTLCRARDLRYTVNVYNRNNMEETKDVIVIPLLRSNVMRMTACNRSKYLYVGLQAQSLCTALSVLRIWKDEEHKFNISPWEHEHGRPIHMFSVSANGSLLTLSMGEARNPGIVTVHDVNDSLQLEVLLPRYIGPIEYIGLLQKSNGNLVVSYVNDRNTRTNLLEIDTTGSIVREYQSSLSWTKPVNFADDYGRIMITKSQRPQRVELLDSEFNLLGVYCLQQDVGKSYYFYDLHYDRERSVIMRSHYDCWFKRNVLTTFRFTEE